MASSTSSVDIRKLVCQWFAKVQQTQNKRLLSIGLHRLKLNVRNETLKWDPISKESYRGKPETHNVANDTAAAAVTQSLQATINCPTKFTLTRGVVSGLETKLQLHLPRECEREAPISLDLSQQNSEVPAPTENKESVIKVDPRGHKVATTVSKWQEYRGHFKCTVALHGKVLMEVKSQNEVKPAERNISDIVNELIDDEQADLKEMKVSENNKVCWTVEGNMEYLWDLQHDVTYM